MCIYSLSPRTHLLQGQSRRDFREPGRGLCGRPRSVTRLELGHCLFPWRLAWRFRDDCQLLCAFLLTTLITEEEVQTHTDTVSARISLWSFSHRAPCQAPGKFILAPVIRHPDFRKIKCEKCATETLATRHVELQLSYSVLKMHLEQWNHAMEEAERRRAREKWEPW